MKGEPEREWTIQAPWGKISLVSWGDPSATPVFLAHGRQDCAVTYQPLIQLLDTKEFYFVSIDMPGSSISDHFPVGVKILRFHYVTAMEVAIDHLKWDKFIFVGHSMGCEVGLFFNSIYPDRITKMILLDAEPTFRRLQVRDPAKYQKMFYDNYYDNYQKENYYYRAYTKSQAIQALMKARNLTEEKAAIIVGKSLKHIKDDLYRFTWGARLKYPAPQNYPNTYYFTLFSNIPPTLLISASGSLGENSPSGSLELIEMMSTLRNFRHVQVEGDHDVHLSHPERVVGYVREFLNERNKYRGPQNYPNTYYFTLFSNIPPTLLISASGSLGENSPSGSLELIEMMSMLRNFRHVQVEGDHDVHLSHPERVVGYVREFLNERNKVRSKL